MSARITSEEGMLVRRFRPQTRSPASLARVFGSSWERAFGHWIEVGRLAGGTVAARNVRASLARHSHGCCFSRDAGLWAGL